MDCFDVNILGCGSATPTLRHLPTTQVVDFRSKLFMIDCGEGTQLELRRRRLGFQKIGHIFLSHLHGDHCFGLIGFLSTLGLNQRGGEIVVHAHGDAERIFRPQLDYFCRDRPYTIRIEPFTPSRTEVIYEDRTLRVSTIPLLHRVPTAGFLFEEKERERHLNVDVVREIGIPVAYYRLIKQGADWTDPETGRFYPNGRLTTPPSPSKKYAYCSDTAYSERILPLIEGVDLLYHESTYMDDLAHLARARGHSTAVQAATIARKAQVKRLCLGHYSARYESLDAMLAEARSVFPETILAQEGLCLHV